ncbi:MAG: glycosyltransferase family 4 protein [Candidatus Falkowbacteria bacterium]
MSKDNVLLFTLEYPPQIGGVATYYSNVVKYWIVGDIFVLTGKKLTKPHWIFSVFYLWQAIKKYKVKTVLVGHVLPLGTVAYWLSRIMRLDYVVFIHGMELGIINKYARKKKITRKILANAKKVITANSYAGELLKELVDEDKVVIVNPGVTIKKQENPPSPKLRRTSKKTRKQLIEKYNLQNKKILLQVGRLVKRKGVDKALEAMLQVLNEVPDLMYIIIGDGPEISNIQYQISNIKNHVILITDASNEEVEAWYNLCDIFIMPARNIDGDFEGFGIVYLEANVHGKPVIAGDSGGVRDAVQNGVNGLLVNPESVEEISKAIVKLCKDEELAKKLGEQGREWVKKFSWEGQVNKIVKLFALPKLWRR